VGVFSIAIRYEPYASVPDEIRFTNHVQTVGLAPIPRHLPRYRQMVLGTSFYSRQTFSNRTAQSHLMSMTSMIQSGKSLVERDLPLDLV